MYEGWKRDTASLCGSDVTVEAQSEALIGIVLQTLHSTGRYLFKNFELEHGELHPCLCAG